MNIFKFAILLSLAWSATPLLSFPNDSNAAITIESDSAEQNENENVTKYIGNVSINRGELNIKADLVTVKYENDRVSTIFCEGNPSNFNRLATNTNEELVGIANKIEYFIIKEIVHLMGNASLNQNGTIIKGDTISYDIRNGIWKARGNSLSERKRIQLVIPPSDFENQLEQAPPEDIAL